MDTWIALIGVAAVAMIVAGYILADWMDSVDEGQSEIGKFTSEMRDDVKSILARLPNEVIAGAGPMRLTHLGESISVELGAKAWAGQIAQELKLQVEGKRPYEISDLAFGYIEEQFRPSQEQDDRIRSCAYENGLTRGKLLDVLALELRDSLLAVSGMPLPQSTAAKPAEPEANSVEPA